ncbi:MAG: ATP-binding protein [Gammaproteobacteria bacterium]|nr:ATP-binding protein [Gammaproteobacteria bacterium]
MDELNSKPFVGKTAYLHQDKFRFLTTADSSGIFIFRVLNLFLLPALYYFVESQVIHSVYFATVLIFAFLLQIIHIVFHIFGYILQKNWHVLATLDASVYFTLAILSGGMTSAYIFVFFPFIIYSITRIEKTDILFSSLLTISSVIIIYFLNKEQHTQQFLLLLIFIVATAYVANQIVILINKLREQSYSTLLSQITANKVISDQQTKLLLEIEERKNTELKLAATLEKAIEATNAKSSFLANMSHELRTPLHAIIGLTDLIKINYQENDNKTYTEYAQTILDSSKHLVTLITDILDYTKTESGMSRLTLKQDNIHNIIREVIQISSPLAYKNNNKIIVQKNDVPGDIHSDMTKIKQVLINLVGNACKFTQDGTISIRTSFTVKDEIEYIHVYIEDTGVGIDKSNMDMIFDIFTQVDSSTSRGYGGTGLGLTLSKHYCNLLGGDIIVDSTPGIGSCFTAIFSANLSLP